MIVLGLNLFHADAAACLVVDGALVAAAEEERFRRIKHWSGYPAEAIAWCLSEAGLAIEGVDCVAINQDPRARLGAKIRYLLGRPRSLPLALRRWRGRAARDDVGRLLGRQFPAARRSPPVVRVEHHRAHLASAFLVSPFAEAAVASIDGFGDFASAAWGVGRGAAIDILGETRFPHSLGIFYQAITQYLGFPHYGDEYKVMGLAPYGGAGLAGKLGALVRREAGGGFSLDLRFFRHHLGDLNAIEAGTPAFADLFSPALEDWLGPRRRPDEPIEARHRDIAHAAQAVYEDALFHRLGALHARTGLSALALAGGCAQNSVANGKIRARTPFREVYVAAASGDAGGALGAALSASTARGAPRGAAMIHAHWGPRFGDDEIARLLRRSAARLAAARCRVERVSDEAALCRAIARAIADGAVIGWFQGRMEWGPRALGARSILADPRRADMKAMLNAKIKRRESFRPFAPAVLAEAAADWFVDPGASPFMSEVAVIRQEKRARIPAVTHVDGTGRLQTVARDANPLFHRLIAAFGDLTGVPMLLNTSFNENEPVVLSPEEALDCFLRTRMDGLALGEFAAWRGEGGGSEDEAEMPEAPARESG